MKRLLLLLLASTLPVASPAQDFLQQWRDDATKGMNAFRAVHRAGIEQSGWRFVTGTQSIEEVPVSDLFIRSIKTEQGPVRSAYLLNVLYIAVPASDSPEYRSTKLLVWFDCKTATYEQRILERYSTVDGSGNPVSRTAEKQEPGAIEMAGSDARSYDKALLAAVCTVKL